MNKIDQQTALYSDADGSDKVYILARGTTTGRNCELIRRWGPNGAAKLQEMKEINSKFAIRDEFDCLLQQKRRKGYRVKQGHRQEYTELLVDRIEG